MHTSWPATLAGCLILAASLYTTDSSHAGTAASDLLGAMRQDAELADACFVDAQTGWAVGDRGVIWQTSDGGRTWRLQDSGVSARLESVYFIDAQHGWAVGGYCEPGTLQTSGVLLRTRDGGRRWEHDGKLALPTLRKVKFFDPQVGWALGEASAMFPSGVFATDNGGRTWTPLPGANRQGWLAGDFVDPLSGAMAGRKGSLAVVRRKGLEEARVPPLGFARPAADAPRRPRGRAGSSATGPWCSAAKTSAAPGRRRPPHGPSFSRSTSIGRRWPRAARMCGSQVLQERASCIRRMAVNPGICIPRVRPCRFTRLGLSMSNMAGRSALWGPCWPRPMAAAPGASSAAAERGRHSWDSTARRIKSPWSFSPAFRPETDTWASLSS